MLYWHPSFRARPGRGRDSGGGAQWGSWTGCSAAGRSLSRMRAGRRSRTTSGPGDTCRSLAKRFYGDETRWEDVYKPNAHLLKDEVQSGSDALLVGTTLTIKSPKFDASGQPVAAAVGQLRRAARIRLAGGRAGHARSVRQGRAEQGHGPQSQQGVRWRSPAPRDRSLRAGAAGDLLAQDALLLFAGARELPEEPAQPGVSGVAGPVAGQGGGPNRQVERLDQQLPGVRLDVPHRSGL